MCPHPPQEIYEPRSIATRSGSGNHQPPNGGTSYLSPVTGATPKRPQARGTAKRPQNPPARPRLPDSRAAGRPGDREIESSIPLEDSKPRTPVPTKRPNPNGAGQIEPSLQPEQATGGDGWTDPHLEQRSEGDEEPARLRLGERLRETAARLRSKIRGWAAFIAKAKLGLRRWAAVSASASISFFSLFFRGGLAWVGFSAPTESDFSSSDFC
jgi:hypothetical protein